MDGRWVLRPQRDYARLIFVGILLAVFLYIILLAIVPFEFGPWAFVAAIALIALGDYLYLVSVVDLNTAILAVIAQGLSQTGTHLLVGVCG